jgi:hypothetical protein
MNGDDLNGHVHHESTLEFNAQKIEVENMEIL